MNIHPVATCKATQQSLEEKWPPHQKKRMTIPNGKKYIYVDKTLCERFFLVFINYSTAITYQDMHWQ